MKTLTVDAQKRVRLPESKPGQVFSYLNNGDGSITLTLCKAEKKEAFPRGSLTKYFTPTKNREEALLQRGCSLEREREDQE